MIEIAIVAVIAAGIFDLAKNKSTCYDGCLTEVLGAQFDCRRDRIIYWFLRLTAHIATLLGCVSHYNLADLSVFKTILVIIMSVLLGLIGPMIAIFVVKFIIASVTAFIALFK